MNQLNLIAQIGPNRTQSNGLCSIGFENGIRSNKRHVLLGHVPVRLLLASSGKLLFKASPSKTSFSCPFLLIINNKTKLFIRDRTASFKVGGLTRSGYGGGVTSSREIFPFLVTNNASGVAKCVQSCQSIPII